ncbi:unnamed protein product [Adineta steineri]|uniref:G-protein coupled receptors family 1 profile domain-containing protein n=1 Tax=Adineta steineri TaxID=433720 RepID=A0A815PRG2_9BILA|nr:unnamed protein product [Adineta steineri]
MNDSVWNIISITTSSNNLYDQPPNGFPSPDGSPPSGSPPGGGSPPPGDSGNSNTAAVITDIERNVALYGYILLFLFGFFGHINSIIIFLRRTLRSVSTSCLFICVSISDITYLLVCIYDFLYTGLALTPIDTATNSNLSNVLCRFRSFIKSVAMCTSAWLLLAIVIDRWLRIRFPFQVKKLCSRKRILIGSLIVLIFAIILNSHLLLPSLGTLSGSDICGPITTSTYSFFFRQVWGILFTCLQTVLPTIALLIVTIDMFRRLLLRQKQKLNRGNRRRTFVWGILFTCLQTVLPTIALLIVTIDMFRRLLLRQKQKLNRGNRRRTFVDRQMLIIMLTSILLFFTTQIPLSLFNILLSPVLQSRLTQTQALELTSIFNFIASINFGTTFYVHCLTSGLFRKEFYNIKNCNRRHRVGVITRVLGVEATQTQGVYVQKNRNQHECSVNSLH